MLLSNVLIFENQLKCSFEELRSEAGPGLFDEFIVTLGRKAALTFSPEPILQLNI